MSQQRPLVLLPRALKIIQTCVFMCESECEWVWVSVCECLSLLSGVNLLYPNCRLEGRDSTISALISAISFFPFETKWNVPHGVQHGATCVKHGVRSKVNELATGITKAGSIQLPAYYPSLYCSSLPLQIFPISGRSLCCSYNWNVFTGKFLRFPNGVNYKGLIIKLSHSRN